jgi:glucodextranase-like protein
MRNLARALVLLTVVGCSDKPYDPDAPAIDPTAPRIHITTPARGTFLGAAGTVEVSGTATDDTGVTSVEVNGVAAVLDPVTGGFKVTVPVSAGTNLLHATAKDAQGNVGKETRAVVAGPLKPIDRMIDKSITASMSAQTFDAIGRATGTFIQTADLGALVQPMNPVVDFASTNGQPDCNYAQARITAMDVGAATVKLPPQTGGLGMDITLDNVTVSLHLQWALLCLDGSRDVVVSASRLHVGGKLAVAIGGSGGFDIALQNPNVTITGFNLDLGGLPGTIVSWLGLDTKLGPVLGWATEKFVVPMLNNALAGLNQTKTLDVLGKQVDVTLAPARIDFDVSGALVQLDTELRAQGDDMSPGFVYVANTVPAMDKSHGFQLAIADDAANQLLGSFWAAKGMDIGLDLKTGPYGDIGKLYDRVELSAAVPPYVDASGQGLVLTIGDMLATFKNGPQIATQIAVNATLELKVTTAANGALRLDVGQPTVYVDVLDDNVDGANQLSNAQFEAISSFALSRIVAVGSGSLGAIPLPSAGGVSVKNVSIQEQTGYVVLDGEVQ